MGRLSLPGDETAAQMFRDASLRLRDSGFEHYEVILMGKYERTQRLQEENITSAITRVRDTARGE